MTDKQPDEIRSMVDEMVVTDAHRCGTALQCVRSADLCLIKKRIEEALRTVSDRAYREGQESMMCTVIKRMKKCEWWCVCGECNFKKEILSLKPTPRDV